MDYPLVSVIIPCYNHGRYLAEAFESVWQQDYPNVEIIVVDDGSADDTKQVTAKYPEVKYFYQTNQGLSAARNTGIKNCSGKYLVFLDADDWLLEGAISTNVDFLKKDEKLAFVSGAHSKVFIETGKIKDEEQQVVSNHYWHLLQGNYIGMHAAVMYCRWIFDKFSFDITLKACEDYDLYLEIARRHPVFHHTKKIAAYRLHNSNMSGNTILMLNTVLKVLKRQKKNLDNNFERKAFENGKKVWKKYYCQVLYKEAAEKHLPFSKPVFYTFLLHQPKLALSYILK